MTFEEMVLLVLVGAPDGATVAYIADQCLRRGCVANVRRESENPAMSLRDLDRIGSAIGSLAGNGRIIRFEKEAEGRGVVVMYRVL